MFHRSKLGLVAAAAVSATLLLAACSSSGGGSPATSDTGTAANNSSSTTTKTTQIKLIDYPTSSVGWIAYIGQQKGFFQAEHIDLTTVPLPAGGTAPSALLGGSAQVAPIDLFNVAPLLKKGVKLELLANTGASFWTLVGKKGTNPDTLKQDLAAMQGKSIASPSVAGSGAQFFHLMTEAYGLGKSGVGVVADPTNATLISGRVPAAMTDDIGACRLETMGYPELMSFVSPPQAKSTYPTAVQTTIGLAGLGYWASTKWAQANAQAVTGFQKAVEKTVEWATAPANAKEVASMIRSSSRNVPSISDTDWSTCVQKVLNGWNVNFTAADATAWGSLLKDAGVVSALPPTSQWFAPGLPQS